MAIIQPGSRPVVDLRGEDGNVFRLAGIARQYAKALGLNRDEIVKEFMALPTYSDKLHYFEKTFGKYVDIILPASTDPRPFFPPPPLDF